MSQSAMPLASLMRDAAAGVPERRLGPAEDRVDARALPLAAGEVDRLAADLAPVVARGVGAVDHLVVLGRGPVGLLEQGPGVVEQVRGELAAGRRVESRSGRRAWRSWRSGPPS